MRPSDELKSDRLLGIKAVVLGFAVFGNATDPVTSVVRK